MFLKLVFLQFKTHFQPKRHAWSLKGKNYLLQQFLNEASDFNCIHLNPDISKTSKLQGLTIHPDYRKLVPLYYAFDCISQNLNPKCHIRGVRPDWKNHSLPWIKKPINQTTEEWIFHMTISIFTLFFSLTEGLTSSRLLEVSSLPHRAIEKKHSSFCSLLWSSDISKMPFVPLTLTYPRLPSHVFR